MELQALRDRWLFLTGQAEEAKYLYTQATKESEANAKKESGEVGTDTKTVDTGKTILVGKQPKIQPK